MNSSLSYTKDWTPSARGPTAFLFCSRLLVQTTSIGVHFVIPNGCGYQKQPKSQVTLKQHVNYNLNI
jgi:hypothetical protein